MSGLQLGNVWIGVQPALGVEGDPMRLLFERDLTPHPQYAVCFPKPASCTDGTLWMREPGRLHVVAADTDLGQPLRHVAMQIQQTPPGPSPQHQ